MCTDRCVYLILYLDHSLDSSIHRRAHRRVYMYIHANKPTYTSMAAAGAVGKRGYKVGRSRVTELSANKTTRLPWINYKFYLCREIALFQCGPPLLLPLLSVCMRACTERCMYIRKRTLRVIALYVAIGPLLRHFANNASALCNIASRPRAMYMRHRVGRSIYYCADEWLLGRGEMRREVYCCGEENTGSIFSM